jgi:hypothetical protein
MRRKKDLGLQKVWIHRLHLFELEHSFRQGNSSCCFERYTLKRLFQWFPLRCKIYDKYLISHQTMFYHLWEWWCPGCHIPQTRFSELQLAYRVSLLGCIECLQRLILFRLWYHWRQFRTLSCSLNSWVLKKWSRLLLYNLCGYLSWKTGLQRSSQC